MPFSFWLSIFILCFCLLLYPLTSIYVNVYNLTKLSNCPLCNGQNLCQFFLDNSCTYNCDFLFRNIMNIVFHRNKLVIFGECKKEIVVFKIYEAIEKTTDGTEITNSTLSNTEEINEQITILLNSSQKIKICPTSEKFNILLSSVMGSNRFSINKNATELYLNTLYMLQVNVEPIIQKAVKSSAVAEYFGGCGLVAVWEYCGDSLTEVFPKLNWTERSLITIKLLEFGLEATFNNHDFAFYFTDMSSDNFAVSSKGEVKLVDLENVIVVDKFPKEPDKNWDDRHQSFHDRSVDGFGFSPEEICSHQISDLNIYSICQGILWDQPNNLLIGGLLTSPPPNMSHVTDLVQECVSPTVGVSRFQVARSIIKVLQDNLHANLLEI